MALLLGTIQPAVADPSPAPGTSVELPPSPDEPTVYTGDEFGAAKPRERRATAEDAHKAAVEDGQESFSDPQIQGLSTQAIVTPPGFPVGQDVDDCLGNDAANTTHGHTYNRFLWCQRGQAPGATVDSEGNVIGRFYLLYDAVTYGRSDGQRNAKVFVRGRGAEWVGTFTGASEERVWVDCADPGSGGVWCDADGRVASKSLSQWVRGDVWDSWTVSSEETQSHAPDSVLFHLWQLKFQATDSRGNTTSVGYTEPRTIRCDSATYFGKYSNKACVNYDVVPHLQYSTKDPKVAEVAEHIKCAQQIECLTYPLKQTAKLIPGEYLGNRDWPGLHRIPYKSTQWYANSTEKNRACNRWSPYQANGPTPGVPPYAGPPEKKVDCDEYPFAASAEGAGSKDSTGNVTMDFSVRFVDRSQNRCAGNALKRYVRDDRILYNKDPYWVQINDTPVNAGPDYCEFADDPEDPGQPDLPPTVDAGPDVHGDEGYAVQLAGSASDREVVPLVSWSYAPGTDVDLGASCAFSDPHALDATITCTDDGHYTLTLTADDGVNPPVSDTATLALANVAPHLRNIGPIRQAGPRVAAEPKITSPKPWDVFKVGTRVGLTAPFFDAGSNDTQTCVIDWDDGSTDDFAPPTRDNCDRDHTFTHAGMYTIKLSVTDDDRGADTASVMVVVYDPDAGFTTAGGWINSPAGALTADPDATGKGHFQFNPKYQKNDEGPAPSGGKVSFKLDGTNLRLDSDSLAWLVVTPDGKVAVRGTGNLDGQGGYGFVAYGHTDPDKFRFVIWRLAEAPHPGGTPIYDNRRTAGFDVDEAQPQEITGSIQIHR